MNACPHCGAWLPEHPVAEVCSGPAWAECRICGWPLSLDGMWRRLESSRSDVKVVLLLGGEDARTATLTGAEAQAELDLMGVSWSQSLPVCESAGMIGIRTGRQYRFVLFAGESVGRALAAMSGR